MPVLVVPGILMGREDGRLPFHWAAHDTYP